MRSVLSRLATISIVFTLWSSPCWAWGAVGHQVIAHIAATELTPAAWTQVEQLLGNAAERAMVEASTWADEIRPQRPATAPWHFVDIPVGSRGYDPSRDCARGDCVVAQIERDERILADRSLLPPVRAEALRFLIHFIGDIHQPLNAADNHDRGGNEIRVVFVRRDTNMHTVWDNDLMRTLGRNGENIADGLEADISQSQTRPWQFGTSADWANESFQIAMQEIYKPAVGSGHGPIILSREYGAMEENIVRTQLEKAGLRLAMVLNRALP